MLWHFGTPWFLLNLKTCFEEYIIFLFIYFRYISWKCTSSKIFSVEQFKKHFQVNAPPILTSDYIHHGYKINIKKLCQVALLWFLGYDLTWFQQVLSRVLHPDISKAKLWYKVWYESIDVLLWNFNLVCVRFHSSNSQYCLFTTLKKYDKMCGVEMIIPPLKMGTKIDSSPPCQRVLKLAFNSAHKRESDPDRWGQRTANSYWTTASFLFFLY